MTVLAPAALPRGTADRVLERLFPEANPFEHDPEAWINHRLREELWSLQAEIARDVDEHRYVAVKSAHDTGKSYIVSRLACWWLDSREDPFVVTTAPTQAQVNAILWREIRKAHKKAEGLGDPLKGRVTLKAEWYFGHDELVAFGRKPADYIDSEQAMQAFQGIHAENVLILIDEACGVPKWLFDAVDALATNENARVVAIGNPDDPASHFADVCRPGSGWKVRKISAFDTPAFTGEEVSERLKRLLVSRTWVEEREQRWGTDAPLYQSKVLGEFPDISDDTLFPPVLIRRAHEQDLPGIARGGYGGDVARMGDDETVIYRNRGGQIRLVASARKQDTYETTGMFARVLRSHGADHIPMNVDADGLGAGVYDSLRAQGLAALEFRGGFPAYDQERFVNRRAEMFWLLREGIDSGLVDLDPLDDDLAAQLGKLKWKQDIRGRIQIESKEDMRKRGVKSPDRADAAAMAYVCPPAFDLQTALAVSREAAVETLTGDLMERDF